MEISTSLRFVLDFLSFQTIGFYSFFKVRRPYGEDLKLGVLMLRRAVFMCSIRCMYGVVDLSSPILILYMLGATDVNLVTYANKCDGKLQNMQNYLTHNKSSGFNSRKTDNIPKP